MDPFQMESDARARSVAKQLRSNLNARGIRLSLGKCLEVSAKLYGYPDWRTLSGSVGNGRSYDDAGVEQTIRIERRRHQSEILLGLGLHPEAVEEMLDTLAPTGRSEHDAEAAGPVMLDDTVAYHPVRFMDAIEAVARQRMFAELREDGVNPTIKESFEINTPSYSLSSLGEMVEDHIEEAAVLPLDDMAYHEEEFCALYEDALKVTGGQGQILDASPSIGELAATDASNAVYAGAWDGLPLTYVHFGTNAFPSPFPFAGIEGCYVRIEVPNERFEVRRVQMTFVASPENVAGLGLGETLSIEPCDALLWNLRTVTLSLDTEDPQGEVKIGDIPGAANYGEQPDEYVDLWRPYLAAPLNAAWNAVRAEREGTLRLRDGVLSDVEPDLVRKLVRARTPEMRRRAVEEIAQRNGEVVVRFMGSVPTQTQLNGDEDLPTGVDTRVGEPAAWSEAYFRLAWDADLPEAAMRFAQRAVDVLESHGQTVSRADRAQFHAVREAALSVRERWAEALSEGIACVSHDPGDDQRMRARLPALAVRAGDATAARQALAIGGMTPPEMAWSEALVATAFGDDPDRDMAITRAVEIDPETASKLAEPVPQMRASERDIARYRGEPASIASLHRDGWEGFPGYRERIGFAASSLRAMGMRH